MFRTKDFKYWHGNKISSTLIISVETVDEAERIRTNISVYCSHHKIKMRSHLSKGEHIKLYFYRTDKECVKARVARWKFVGEDSLGDYILSDI